MGKETPLSPKIHQTSNNGRRISNPWIVGVVFLCLLCYLFGGWSAGKGSTIAIMEERSTFCSNGVSGNTSSDMAVATLDFTMHHDGSKIVGKETTDGDVEEEKEEEVFEPCDIHYSEYTPCEDVQRSLQFDRDRLIYRERHCPAAPKKKKKVVEKNEEENEEEKVAVENEVGEDDRLRCLVPAPPGYRNPPGWPKSRDMAWYANVPHRELTVEKAIQNWIHFDGGDKFRFPGGGTMFPNGASAYIDDIGALLPQLYDGSIRTALDTGCGVASWGAYLMDRNILTMSFAPRDTHEAQVQFALERGVPAMLGVMASKRLPYPARAFDMAHCSRCLIPWAQYDGLYLIEVDRVLRPGGYWILSGPPINWKTHWRGWQRSKEDLQEEQRGIEDVANQLCWNKVAEKGNLAIWQKPLNHINCIPSRKTLKKTPFCKPGDPDTAWYTEMDSCITPLPEGTQDKNNVAGGSLEKWPMRLTTTPPRISSGSLHRDITEEYFMEDTDAWKQRVAYYVDSLIPPLGNNRYRNIIDMNAGMGGFAAALSVAKVNAWVMNVVPQDSKINTLGAIYERGLIGTYQDWCEAFSTYPRTYDLIHADGIFSTYRHKCDIVDILLEMDRILRPEGAVIIRDEVDVLVKVARKINRMRWNSRMADHESGPLNSQKILVAVKSYWVGENTNSTSKK